MRNVKSFYQIIVIACVLCVLCSSRARGEPTGAELVQAARAGENWLHEIDSLYIRIESTSTKTPEGLASRHAELRQQFPEGPLEADRFPELKPVTTAILEYAIDESRVRFLNDQQGSRCDLKIWDGKQLMFHEAPLQEGQEQYTLDRSLHGYFQDVLASGTSWPRAQPHAFWWDDKDLDEYLSYIPFPATTMAEAPEKARFAWGVKSLPWLILTDQKHTVEANGFSLAELDVRI